MNKILKLSFRNLTRQKRRNIILVIAIAFGFFIVTSIDGLTTGTIGNLEDLIAQLEGGTVLISGYEKIQPLHEGENAQLVNIIRDKEYISSLIEKSGINYTSISRFTSSSGQIVFNGKKILCTMYGRELDTDRELRDSFTIIEGSKEAMMEENAIIITDSMAKTLNVQLGDSVFFTTTTIYGQNTVGEFIVKAIVKGNNFFSGMTAYAPIKEINTLLDIGEDGYSTCTLYLANKNDQEKVALNIEEMIRSDGVPVSDRMAAKSVDEGSVSSEITKQFTDDSIMWEGIKYQIKTINDVVPLIKTVINVVHTVTTIILVIILIIVMIGISNTYRMILYERIREIGTMRALGMGGRDTGAVFTSEALILSVTGACVGLVLSIVFMCIICSFGIHSESLGMFLHNGHLSFKLSPVTIIVQYALMIVLTVIAVSGTAHKASRMSPAEALRTVK